MTEEKNSENDAKNNELLIALSLQAKTDAKIMSSLYQDLLDFYLNEIALNKELINSEDEFEDDLWM